MFFSIYKYKFINVKYYTRTHPPPIKRIIFDVDIETINKIIDKIFELLIEYKNYIPGCSTYELCEKKIIKEQDNILNKFTKYNTEYTVANRIIPEYTELSNIFNTVLLKLRDIHITKHKKRIDMINYNHVYDEAYYNNIMVIEINQIYKYSNNIFDNAFKYLETQKSTSLIIVKGNDYDEFYKNQQSILSGRDMTINEKERYINYYYYMKKKLPLSSSIPLTDYNETMKKISSVKKDNSFLSFLTKPFTINKIKLWKEKIEELLSKFTASIITCDNFNECKDIIDYIYYIIYIFITNPNTMNDIISIPDSSSVNTYDYRRYKIYSKYLKDKYNNNLTDDDLKNKEYIKLLNNFKHILEQTKQIKLEYCKEKFQIS